MSRAAICRFYTNAALRIISNIWGPRNSLPSINVSTSIATLKIATTSIMSSNNDGTAPAKVEDFSPSQAKETATSKHAENLSTFEDIAPSPQLKTTRFMIAFSVWIGLGGWALNFDTGYTGLLLRMVPFNKSFGHCAMVPAKGEPAGATIMLCELSATQQSVTASIYLLFMALGAAVAGVTGSLSWTPPHYTGWLCTYHCGRCRYAGERWKPRRPYRL